LQLVTAYDTENGLVLSQLATKNKNGEIRVVQQMLDVLNVKGSVLTMDALHCQTETLRKIADKKAHVVVQVKKNQPNLWNAVNTQFQKEQRKVYQLKPKFNETLKARWPSIRSVIAVERHRTIKEKTSIDTSFYISSMSLGH
ncbi:hypothetical protein N482_25260, partial [Pseudoalteromonas luteoviolacea NCIMB 1942]